MLTHAARAAAELFSHLWFALTRALRARRARPPEVAEKAYLAAEKAYLAAEKAYLAALQPRAQRA